MESKPQGWGGRVIHRARLRAGLSQRELAESLSTSQSLIARWERGRVAPSLDTVIRAVRACGLDLDVRLIPSDDQHAAHVSDNLKLAPAQRLQKMLEGIEAIRNLKSKVVLRD